MSSLNNEQKQLLFDHCIGLTKEEHFEKAESLISRNEEANLLYSKMKAVFAPLSYVKLENCPDDLVEMTFSKIRNIPVPDKQLTELLAAERNKRVPVKIGFFRNFSEVAAIAASILIITGILVPTFGYARQKYLQQRCEASVGDIYNGYLNYVYDHDGKAPTVARATGANWLKASNETESNTSHMYLLVTGNYVQPDKFICPSKRRCSADKAQYKTYLANYQQYKDFPDRAYVTYSFAIGCQNGKLSCRRVLLSDSNPIFDNLPENTLTVVLKKEQLIINSFNHNNHGQNVLFGDGCVDFMKTRKIGSDDIFTLDEYDIYKGTETSTCSKDQFVAP
jgi:hypothetical protein